MTGSLAAGMSVLLIATIAAAAYLLPTLIGWARHVPHLGSVAAINILLGWTLVGWAVAAAMALRSSASGGPVVNVVQNLPPAQQWPAPPPPPGGHSQATARPPSQAPPLVLPPRVPHRHDDPGWRPEEG